MNAGGWVKLPRQESPSFRRLPLIARCVASQLLKLTDSEGWIDLGTTDVEQMASVLKRSMGGDRYDLKALKRHLPLLIKSSVYYPKGQGLQAGEWAGYEAPSEPDADSLEASYEIDTGPSGASYKLHTGSIQGTYEPHAGSLGQSNALKSKAAEIQKERKTERHIKKEAVSGLRARQIFVDIFTKWRAHHLCEWSPGRRDWARIDEVSLKLIPVSRTRGIPYAKVVRAALRGYTATDAKDKNYSLPWFAKDASAYLTPRSFEPSPVRKLQEEIKQDEADRMTYSEAVAAGLIDPSDSSILKMIGDKK